LLNKFILDFRYVVLFRNASDSVATVFENRGQISSRVKLWRDGQNRKTPESVFLTWLRTEP